MPFVVTKTDLLPEVVDAIEVPKEIELRFRRRVGFAFLQVVDERRRVNLLLDVDRDRRNREVLLILRILILSIS